MRHSLRFLLVLLVLPSIARAQADASLPAHLTLTEALNLVRTRGYDVLLAEANARAAAADVTVARSVANPQLSLGVGRSFGYHPSGAGGSATSWSAGVADQGVVADALFGKRGLRISVTEAALRAARQQQADALRMLSFQLEAQYVQCAVANRVLGFAREVQAVYGEVLKLTRIRWNAGAVSEAEVAKAETAELEAEQDVTSAEHDVLITKTQLAFLLGARGPLPTFSVDESLLDAPTPSALTTTNAVELLRVANESRADVKAAVALVESAAAAQRLARRQRAPDVVLSLSGSGEGSGQNALAPPTLALGVSVTPALWNQYNGEIGRAAAFERQNDLELQKLQAQVAAEVNTAFTNYGSSKERLVRMQSSLLGSARKARDLVRIQYEKGAASLLELLDAQRTFISNNLEYLQDVADFRTSIFQIEQAVGKEMTP